MSSDKAELAGRLLELARAWSTETVMFHTAIAETSGLSATDTKAMDYIARLGPLTAKELARHSGLAPASVTALIDRLERKGLVLRKPHPGDRRKVLVEFNVEHAKTMPPFWQGLIEESLEYFATLSVEQLETIADFMVATTEITRRAKEQVAVLSTKDGQKNLP
ncbi:MarR family winged helix-turn-helix transcriptional regulator [Amycolatopsis sp. NPDC059657]|uniref:MarR family winged helix-turn-helix transcriptional regulator n=1 Tax=Amycolatopsis sp. NPDC059657 TaxID=3346899 RepID=UPI003670A5C2